MCEEESDDAEAVAKLLEINDSIHRTIERYKLMKAGNVEAANQIAAGTLGTTTGVGKNAANQLSLIDFDPEPPAPDVSESSNGALLGGTSGAGPTPAQTSVEDDLLGLSLDSGPTGMISLGPSSNASSQPLPFSITPQPQSTPIPTGPSIVASTPSQPSSKPNYDAFASLTSALPSSKPATPVPSLSQQQQQRPSSQVVDPFASLVSRGSRPSTPSAQLNPSQPVAQSAPRSSALLDMSGPAPGQSTVPAASADDEWNFASSLPENPAISTVQVHSSQIAIQFTARRQEGQPTIRIQAAFSNNTGSAVSGLHFQVAVEKVYTLQLKPQTGREMAPNQKHGIQQEILLNGVPPGKGNSVKMRFKVAYQVNGQPFDEQGNVPSLGIA